MKKQIDVLVYLTNREECVRRCVEAVVQHTPSTAGIVFLGDALSPALSKYVLSKCRRVGGYTGLLANHVTLGYSASVNRGIKSTKAPYFVVINDDVVVTKDWLDKLLSCLLSEPSIAIACPFINGGFRQAVCESVPNGTTVNAYADFIEKSSKREYPRITSADTCLFVKREILPRVGLFHEVAFPEVEYCHRVRKQGFCVAIADDLFVDCHKKERAPAVGDDGSFFEKNSSVQLKSTETGYDEALVKKRGGTTERSFKSTSVIVPIYNHLDTLDKCIKSVVVKSFTPYKIVLVNDGSDEATTHYCERLYNVGIADAYIHNKRAVGFSKACNQGLLALESDYYCLLNSDAIVGTDDWLRRIIVNAGRAEYPPGIIGVLSNNATSQTVISGERVDESNIDKFAQIIDEVTEFRNPRTQLVHGFCYIIQAEVLKRVGLLDEKAFPHYGSEDDYTMKAVRRGFRPIIVDSVFVYHKGQTSYGVETRNTLRMAAIKDLVEKWGRNNIREAMTSCAYSLKYIKEKINVY